jgi:hypothetical protein
VTKSILIFTSRIIVVVSTEFKIVAKVLGTSNVMDWEFQQRLVPRLKNKPKLEPAQKCEPNPDSPIQDVDNRNL